VFRQWHRGVAIIIRVMNDYHSRAMKALPRLAASALSHAVSVMPVTVYRADTGLALHLEDLGGPAGCHLENLVLNDLLAWRDVRLDRPEVLYGGRPSGRKSTSSSRRQQHAAADRSEGHRPASG
jgi:hypothetical protein